MDGVILAIDLGRFNSVCCWYGGPAVDPTFRTVATSPAEFRRELLRRPVARVVIEACSPAGWVHDLCGEVGLRCEVANTNGAAWQWRHVKRKTDRDDALKLARLSAIGELATVPVAPKPQRQWKSLIGLRKRLVGERGRGQNRIRGLLAGQGLPSPAGNRAWTQTGLAGLDSLARPLAECGPDELWRGELAVLLARHRFLEGQLAAVETALDSLAAAHPGVRLLTTIPGVGVRTAEMVAAYHGDGRRFRS